MKLLVPLVLLAALCFAEEEIKCGTKGKGNEKIVGGEIAKPNSWPWQISLQGAKGGHFCGGTIVKPNWIVTASHCLQRDARPGNYKIVAGDHSLKNKDDGEQEVKIEKIIKHPKYNERKPPKYDYDIALLKLKTNLTYNDKVRPACLPTKLYPAGKKCYVTGWGLTQTKPKQMPDKLQQLVVPLISSDECKKKWTNRWDRITSRMICSGYAKAGKGICKGDSGGSMVCKNKSGVWELVGAPSFVKMPCGSEDWYDVFANVENLKDWVEGYINKE